MAWGSSAVRSSSTCARATGSRGSRLAVARRSVEYRVMQAPINDNDLAGVHAPAERGALSSWASP